MPQQHTQARRGIGRHVLWVFFAAVAVYGLAFYFIEHSRQKKGAWRLRFYETNALPALAVSQPALGISNVVFVFPDDSVAGVSLPESIVFDSPRTNVPFGRVIFFDTTFLPGTVTLDMFGHEIELLPRVLLVNKREIKWEPDLTLSLERDERYYKPLPESPQPDL